MNQRTSVPAWPAHRAFERYGRIWWIVYDNFAKSAELSPGLYGDIFGIGK